MNFRLRPIPRRCARDLHASFRSCSCLAMARLHPHCDKGPESRGQPATRPAPVSRRESRGEPAAGCRCRLAAMRARPLASAHRYLSPKRCPVSRSRRSRYLRHADRFERRPERGTHDGSPGPGLHSLPAGRSGALRVISRALHPPLSRDHGNGYLISDEQCRPTTLLGDRLLPFRLGPCRALAAASWKRI